MKFIPVTDAMVKMNAQLAHSLHTVDGWSIGGCQCLIHTMPQQQVSCQDTPHDALTIPHRVGPGWE